MSNPLVGSTILNRITVTDPDTGALTNATDIELVVRDPSGNETPEVPTNPSTGIYEHYLTLDEESWFTLIWTVTVGSYVTVKECSVCAAATVLVGA